MQALRTRPAARLGAQQTRKAPAPLLPARLGAWCASTAPRPVRVGAAEKDTVPAETETSNSNGAAGGSSTSGPPAGTASSAVATARASSGAGASSSGAGGGSATASQQEEEGFSWSAFWNGPLPGKLAGLLGLIVLSRVGVYVRLPGVDVDAFGETMASNGLLGYVDALSGGSISKVGLFSLGIIPYINASIVLQLFSAAFPSLKKMQREDGPQGRARFQWYQKLAAFAFAIAQAVGQLTYLRPYVTDFSPEWLAGSTLALVAGAMSLVYIADTITELKLGNGTSVLIFAGIASSLPASVGALLAQNASDEPANIAVYAAAFFLTTLGIIYVQEAERRIPINYSGRYQAGALARQSYLPFKVNATGVMPLIFASSLLGLPLALARFTDSTALDGVANAVGPGGALYLPASVAMIAFFNYYYTFLQ
ncbi:Preprotein translocase subunit secY, partial [Monoraphidium neglectum]